MIKLNLIPIELRGQIKSRHIYEILIRVYVLLVIIFIMSAAILVSANQILKNNSEKTRSEEEVVARQVNNFSGEIKRINDKVSLIEAMQAERIDWSKVLNELNVINQADVRFSQIKLDGLNKSVLLKGRSASGEALFSLKEAIDKTLVFTAVNFPLEKILIQDNIDFLITLNWYLDEAS